jgi:hypothetical protein
MEQHPDCFYQIWSSDPVPVDKCPIFAPPEDVHGAKSLYNQGNPPIKKNKSFTSYDFDSLVQMFIDLCEKSRMNMGKDKLKKEENIFFDNVDIFDMNVKKWYQDNCGSYDEYDDYDDLFLVRLIKVLEIRVSDCQSNFDKEFDISCKAKANYDKSNIASERALHDSNRAVKNATVILNAALSDLKIAEALLDQIVV